MRADALSLARLALRRAHKLRPLLPLVVTGALLAALALIATAGHEGYWYVGGDASALPIAARLAAALVGLVAAVAAAVAVVDSAASRRTLGDAPSGRRAATAMLLGDLLGPLLLAAGAAPVAILALRANTCDPTTALVVASTPVAALLVAATIARAAPRGLGAPFAILAGIAGGAVGVALAWLAGA
ncbi:MAG: hypothetical protein EXR73_06555 [Myxococcales bacterium]|nr:hypothetical protein [Myxococcales bacterium]